MAATGLSPPRNKTLGRGKRKEESVLETDVVSGSESTGLRETTEEVLLGAFKTLVLCLEFSEQILTNHLLGDSGVLADNTCSLNRYVFCPWESPVWWAKDGRVRQMTCC